VESLNERFFSAAMAYGFPAILKRPSRETMNYKAFVEKQIALIRESVGSGTQDKS
jgi:hypothetical protein